MQEEYDILDIYNNITDLFLKYSLCDTLNNYLSGDKEAYGKNFLTEFNSILFSNNLCLPYFCFY